MKRKNNTGSVYKLSGNRRNPYAARITIGYEHNEETKKSKPIYQFIGFYPTRDEALAALLEYNRNPYELNSPTFREVYDKWYAYKEESGITDDTLRRYALAFNYLEPLHNTPIKDFTLPRIQAYFDKLKASKAVIHLVRTTLRQCINYSIKRGLLPIGACDIVNLADAKARKETKEVKRTAFSKEERKTLWKYKDNEWIKVILFCIYTGVRYNELENLTPDCWHDDYIEIRTSKTVSGIREVPLCDCVKDLLPIRSTAKYSTYRYNYISSLQQIGITGHHVHDTRHTFISIMTEVETDPRILKQIVGHREDNVTEKVYTHISMEKKLEAVNKINCY